MRLVACPTCHTQYDVTRVIAETFACRCGAELKNEALEAVDAPTRRCGSCGALVQEVGGACDYCGSVLAVQASDLSLICPECFARNADASRFCTACGVAFRPEPVLVDGHELPCPACNAGMPPRQFMGLGLNECPKCNGLWVPEEHFETLVRRSLEARRNAEAPELPPFQPRVTGSNPAAQRVHYRKCPECDGYMQRRNFGRSSGVILDVCGNHGTWLDADELEQIAGFIVSGGDTSDLRRNKAERRAEVAFAQALAESQIRRPAAGDGTTVGSLLDVLARLFR